MRPIREDEGFSLLEVLFAAFVAFFVLTALFGVLVTSATEGRISKVDTVATNLAQLCIEQARSLPYEKVGIVGAPSGQVEGSLESSETTSFQGIDYHIRREVVWVTDALNPGGSGQDYKQLIVRVNDWSTNRVTRAVSYIRDQKNESLPGPRVEFTTKPAMVKPPNPVVFVGSHGESLVWNGGGTADTDSLGAPSIQASASVDATGGKIIRMEFQAGNAGIGAPWTETPVQWVPRYPDPDPFPIDLTAETSGTPVFTEGSNIVKVVATGNNLGTSSDMLILTLDNVCGFFASGSTLSASAPDKNSDVYRGGSKLTWNAPKDGNESVPYYDLWITPYWPTFGGPVYKHYMVPMGDKGTYTVGAPSSVASVPPFTIQTYRLTTRSVRGLAGNAIATGRTVTPPRLEGTVENLAPDKKTPDTFQINLAVSAPTTGLAGSTVIQYDVYSMEAATYTYPGSGDLTPTGGTVLRLETPNPWTRPIGTIGPSIISFAPKNNNCNKYFQVVARITGPTVTTTVRSNVIGPQPADGPPRFLDEKPLPIPGVSP